MSAAGRRYGMGGDRPQVGDVVRYPTAKTDWKVYQVGNYVDGPYWVSIRQIGGVFKRHMVPASRLRLFRRKVSA